MSLYRQIAEADQQAKEKGIVFSAIALTLEDQHLISKDAGLKPGRLLSVMGIPVVELQIIHPTSDVPSNLKEVN